MVWTTGDDNFGVTSYIVDPTQGNGNYQTIAAALTAASAASFAGDIFIRPGTYTENLTLVAGVNLVAWPADASAGTVIINGNCTLSTAGTVTISGIRLQTNSAACVTVSGSVASILNLVGCYINALNNSAIAYSTSSASSALNLFNCQGNLATTGIALYTATVGIGTITIDNCYITNTGYSSTASNTSAAAIIISNSYLSIPISATSGAITQNYFNSYIFSAAATAISISGANGYIINCIVGTNLVSTSSVIVGAGGNVVMSNCFVYTGTTPSITGSGTLKYNSLSFDNPANSAISVTTQTNSGTLAGGRFQAPSAGFLGENLTSTAAQNSVSLVSATFKTITSVALTPGNWLLHGIAIVNGTLTGTRWTVSISATNNAVGSLGYGIDTFDTPTVSTAAAGLCGVVPGLYVTVTSNTTYFLTAACTFTIGTGAAGGRLTAVRVG
jgi:hypothetical protein